MLVQLLREQYLTCTIQHTNVPKITTQRTGQPILAKHGVTQGRKSSTSLFSFAICDIPKAVAVRDSCLDGNNVLQLADDASIITNSFKDLSVAFQQIIQASCEKFMVTNIEKTFYLNLSKHSIRLPIYLPDNQTVQHADNDEHLYLGMWLTTSNETMQHIKCKLKHRALNIVTFYAWLNINEDVRLYKLKYKY